MSNVKASLESYEAALNTMLQNLPQGNTAEDTSFSVRLLSVLLRRDALDHQLQSESLLEPEVLERLVALDSRWRCHARELAARVSVEFFQQYRASRTPPRDPPEAAWWWYLDQAATEEPPSLNETYQQFLADLITALDSNQRGGHAEVAPQLLALLLTRDRLETQCQQAKGWDSATFEQVTSVDQKLKALTNQINAQVSPRTFQRWRDTHAPASSSWWWFLDQRQELNLIADAFWTGATVLLFLVALALLAEVVRRLLTGGTDVLSLLNTSLQGLLTLLIGGAALKVRAWLDHLLQSWQVRRRYWPAWKLAIAVSLLLLAWGAWESLPYLAVPFEKHGIAQLNANPKRLTQAITSLEFANLLDPNNAIAINARYSLGDAYEEASRYDEAIREYTEALRLNAEHYPSYNNLARLLLRKQQPGEALELLNQAYERVFRQRAADQEAGLKRTQQTILKNRGWAYHALGFHTVASRDLQRAIGLREDAPAPHCLLAQVYEALEKPAPDINREWRACVTLTVEGESIEAQWWAMAQERLANANQSANPKAGETTEGRR